MVTINLGNKTFYLLVGLIGILVVAGIGVAWNSGNPAVMGHTIDEIEGLNTTIRAIVIEVVGDGGAICTENPQANTKEGARYRPLTIGAVDNDLYSCFSDIGCVIVQEIRKNDDSLYLKRQYQYTQDSAGKWWSSYYVKGDKTNGDTNGAAIVPSWNGLSILDDSTKTGGEIVADKLTIRDENNNYYQVVYICSNS